MSWLQQVFLRLTKARFLGRILLVSINQQAYIESMVEKFRLTGARRVSTPMEMNAQFTKEQCPSTVNQVARMKGVPYSEAIGSVLWPVVVSRPDAAYTVGILSQFIQNPGPAHWEGVKRVISYLGRPLRFHLVQ